MSSKTITIDIISEPIITHINNTKGGYDALEIAFKDQGKVAGKKLNSIYQRDIFEQVKGFQRGDRIEVGLEKEKGTDDREYWQWKSVQRLDAGEIASGGQVNSYSDTANGSRSVSDIGTNQGSVRATGKVTGSNYETPEERALKQVLIVRQSSLEQANKYLSSVGAVYNLEYLLETAGEIYEWVFDQGRLTPPALNVEEANLDIPAAIKATSAQETPASKKPQRKSAKSSDAVRTNAQKAIDDLDDDIPF